MNTNIFKLASCIIDLCDLGDLGEKEDMLKKRGHTNQIIVLLAKSAVKYAPKTVVQFASEIIQNDHLAPKEMYA